MLAPLAQIDPAVFDHVDMDGLAKYIIRILGVPAETVLSDEQVAMARRQRAQQQQQAAEQQEAVETAEAMGKAAPMVKAVS